MKSRLLHQNAGQRTFAVIHGVQSADREFHR
jgi:hypothetical protein